MDGAGFPSAALKPGGCCAGLLPPLGVVRRGWRTDLGSDRLLSEESFWRSSLGSERLPCSPAAGITVVFAASADKAVCCGPLGSHTEDGVWCLPAQARSEEPTAPSKAHKAACMATQTTLAATRCVPQPSQQPNRHNHQCRPCLCHPPLPSAPAPPAPSASDKLWRARACRILLSVFTLHRLRTFRIRHAVVRRRTLGSPLPLYPG